MEKAGPSGNARLPKKHVMKVKFNEGSLPLGIDAFASAFQKMATDAEQRLNADSPPFQLKPVQWSPEKSPNVGSRVWWRHYRHCGTYSGADDVGFEVCLQYSLEGTAGFAGVGFTPSHVSGASLAVTIADNPRSANFGCVLCILSGVLLGTGVYQDEGSFVAALLVGGIGGAIIGVILGKVLALVLPGSKERARSEQSRRLALNAFSAVSEVWADFQRTVLRTASLPPP